MTAEIIIMNKSAIALAADSASTLPIFSNGERKYKIYNTSNKLFMLSKYMPIGIMIYGNAEIDGYPWELVIKEFRKELGSKSYSTVKEYASRFILFLQKYIPGRVQDFSFIAYVASFFHSSLLQEINKAVETATSNREIDKFEIEELIKKTISESLKSADDSDEVEGVPPDYSITLIKKYRSRLNKVIDEVFKDLPISPELRKKLYIIGVSLITKKYAYCKDSGVVIAGFGNKEEFPAVYALSIDGVFEKKLKFLEDSDSRVDVQHSAYIIPFAQHEMVNTFIEGVDPTFNELLDGYLTKFFNEYPVAIMDLLVKDEEHKQGILDSIEKYNKEKLEQLKKNLDHFKKRNFINPIIDSVQFLPIDELASMAESLVNLTSFKRRVSLDTETVGGPIDVAIITKGDGFIWIKRKHYFDEKLNHHFFNNYYRECK